MNYTVEIASDGTVYVPNFVKTGLDIQVILKLLPWQSAKLQCW
jgi:hypothetical protein